jgi:hypothetical protein
MAELEIITTFTRHDASGNRTLLPVDHCETRDFPLISSSAETSLLL